MNQPKKHIDLLHQYADRSISSNDRYELEKAALDDPFLFEALEGLAYHDEVDTKIIVTSISQKTKKDLAVRQLLPARWLMGAAASIVLLLTIGFFILGDKSQSTSQDTVAKAPIQKAPDDNPEIAMLTDDEETADIDRQNVKEETSPDEIITKTQNPEIASESKQKVDAQAKDNEVTAADKNSLDIDITPPNKTEMTIASEDQPIEPKVKKSPLTLSKESLNPKEPVQTITHSKKISKQEKQAIKIEPGTIKGISKDQSSETASLAMNVQIMNNEAQSWLAEKIIDEYNGLDQGNALTPNTSMIITVDEKSVIKKVTFASGCRECVEAMKPLLMDMKIEHIALQEINKPLRFVLKSK